MKRSELIQEVAKRCELPEEEVKHVLLSLCDSLTYHLSRGDSVHLWGFGKFEPRLRKAHIKLNPLVGEYISIPERVSVTFVPAGRVREMLNQ